MKTVIELAKEAGIPCFAGMYVVTEPEELERFTAIVRAEALEEAAKVCEEEHDNSKFGCNGMHCAAAIRGLK
jgi:hypothetical protein